MLSPQLEIKNLSVGYKGIPPVLTDFSCVLSAGLYGMIGVNGSGKSTLLRTIAGLQQALSGSVLVNSESIHSLDVHKRARYISLVLTGKINVPYMSVEDLIASGRAPHTGFSGKLTQTDKQITSHYLQRCEIEHLKNKLIQNISDGEFQRAMIARALCQETPVILLDEPASYLDFRARYEIMELLKQISLEENKIIIFSSHDLEIVFRIADASLVVNAGACILKTTADLLRSDLPEKLFEGTNLFFDRQSMSVQYKTNIKE